MAWYDWRPYVPVARAAPEGATREMRRGSRRRARRSSPVVIEGAHDRLDASGARPGATTSSATATSPTACRAAGPTSATARSWTCRSRAGTVKALVSGSELYRISVEIAPLPKPRWQAVVRECAGKIGSLVELLQGKLSRAVMEMLIRREDRPVPVGQGDRLRVLLPGLGGDVQARRRRPLRRRRPPRRRARAALPAAARRPTGPAHGGQQRRDPGGARRRGTQADRRDRAGRGLWDRAGRVLEGARHATGGRTRKTAEGSVGRRPDSTGTCHRPRSRSPPRGAPAPGDSQCQGRPAGPVPPARRSHRRATGD